MRNIFGLLVAGLLSSTATASPPPADYYGGFNGYYFICDSQEQATAIAQAGKDGADAVMAKFREYYALKNEKGESACGYQQLPGAWQVGERIEFGPIKYGKDNHPATAWILHIGNADMALWMLYADTIEGVKPSSMPPSGREGKRSYILYEPNPVPWLWMFGA